MAVLPSSHTHPLLPSSISSFPLSFYTLSPLPFLLPLFLNVLLSPQLLSFSSLHLLPSHSTPFSPLIPHPFPSRVLSSSNLPSLYTVPPFPFPSSHPSFPHPFHPISFSPLTLLLIPLMIAHFSSFSFHSKYYSPLISFSPSSFTLLSSLHLTFLSPLIPASSSPLTYLSLPSPHPSPSFLLLSWQIFLSPLPLSPVLLPLIPHHSSFSFHSTIFITPLPSLSPHPPPFSLTSLSPLYPQPTSFPSPLTFPPCPFIPNIYLTFPFFSFPSSLTLPSSLHPFHPSSLHLTSFFPVSLFMSFLIFLPFIPNISLPFP